MVSKVTVLKTKPETVLNDYARLMDKSNYRKFISKNINTILKLNLSWSLYFPACSTQPWQLEGVVRKMQKDGYKKLIPVENRTVVTDVWKGARYNKWLPVLEKYKLKYQPLTDVKWIDYKPKHEMLAMDKIFTDGYKIPKMFLGSNVIHFPTVKCVHGDTEIFLADGSLVKIKEIIDGVHYNNEITITADGDAVAKSNHDISTLSNDGQIINGKALQFWKTPHKGNVFFIKTKTGREVKVSEEHPFLTPNGWKKAKELTVEDRLAVPKIIDIKGEKQLLPKLTSSNRLNLNINKIRFIEGYTISKSVQKKIVSQYLEGKETNLIVKKYNISKSAFKYIIKKYNIPLRGQRNWNLKVPKKTSSEFWRWFGYFMAEGNLDKNDYFAFVNSSYKIQQDYKHLTKKLFGLNIQFVRIKDSRFRSIQLSEFFQKLGLPKPLNAKNKFIPRLLFKCTKKEIANFLCGYFDGDVCLTNSKKSKLYHNFVIHSKSKQLISDVQLILLRLGIISFKSRSKNKSQDWKRKKTYSVLSIYRSELLKLSRFFKLKKYSYDYIEDLRKVKLHTNWNTVPLQPQLFRKLRESLSVKLCQLTTKPQSLSTFENGRRGISYKKFINYVKILKKADKKNQFKEEFKHFDFILSDNIFWDHIKEIKQIHNEGLLYDLSVPNYQNFVGNGIILHNTHGHTKITLSLKNAFGGLITERRHHCHKMIHEILVDLLQIQKEIHKGIFAVADGTVCGDGNGPRTMIPRIKNYILASNDQVAIDAVSAKMMGFDPMKIKFIKLAHDKGLGVGDFDQIDIVGEDVSKVNFNFSTGKSPVIYFDQLFRKGAFSFVEPLLFHTGLFNACIFGSEFYHDYAWYPTIGKHRIRKFRKTDWGKLFDKY